MLQRPGPSAGLLPLLALLLVLLQPLSAASQPPPPPYQPDATAARSEVPRLYKWNLDPLYPSDEAWRAAVDRLSGEIPQLAAYQGRLADPAALEECLDLYFRLHNEINHTTLYANLLSAAEQSNDHYAAMQTESLAVLDNLMATAGFIRGEVLGLPMDHMRTAYQRRPGLAAYEPYLDNLLRRQSRVLTPEAERVLQLGGDNLWAEIDLNEIPSPLEDAFGALLTDIQWPVVHDEEGNEIQMTLSNYPRLRASESRQVRREAVEAFLGKLRQFQHAFAATLGGQFETDVFYARARNYDTALEAYLDKDDLDVAVFDNLVSTVNAHLEPLHRYVELRKKVMGYDDLHLYDLYTPLVAGVDADVSFEEARATLLEALKPLGPEYLAVLREGLDLHSGWLDLYPSNDKQSGAFSASVYGSHPYVLMNYQDSVDDMFTLAHEYGHAIHSHLAMTSQPYSSFRYVPFLAEIASTCNESILADHLISHASDDALKAALLVERAESIRTTIYRQTLFAEFERKVHGYVEEGTPVTATLLDETYRDLVSRYYGPGFTVDQDDGLEWAYVGHFYYKYYVYNYATGLSSGLALAEKLRDGKSAAVEAYLDMLRGGCSKPPLVLLKGAGVDLTTPQPIEAALQVFDQTLDELETLLVH